MDEIVSTHVHDFRYCSCKALAVDGGNEYTRRIGIALSDDAMWQDTSLYELDLKVYLLSGIAGAGKTHWIARQYWSSKSIGFSANDFFMRDGKYKWDATNLGRAHADCLRQFTEACMGGSETKIRLEQLNKEKDSRKAYNQYLKPGAEDRYDSPILVVDNTNTMAEEIAPYYSVAKAYGYQVELVTLLIDSSIAYQRNIHSVPLHAVENQDARLRARKLPKFMDLKKTILEWDNKYNHFHGDY